MKKKYTIHSERREVYSNDTEVEANSEADAISNVEEHYADGEFDGEKYLFYSPDVVEDRVYCTREEEV